jgi:hypothetical protein
MNTWPFSHALALLLQHNEMLHDYWLAELWDCETEDYRPDALTPGNLELIERDVMEQQMIAL